MAVIYAPVRFLLDFLRIEDVRYFHFTPGQYSAVAFLLLGVVILWRIAGRSPNRAGGSTGEAGVRSS